MSLITNMRVWMKCMLPLTVLAVAAGFVTIFMAQRMSGIDTAYSRLIDQQARAAIEAVQSDTITSDVWGLSYQIIVESDPAALSALVKKLDGKKAEYQGHLDAIRAAFPNDADVAAQTRKMSEIFGKAHDIAMRAGALGVTNTTESNAQAAALMRKEFEPANAVLGDTSDDFYKSLIARLDRSAAELAGRTQASRLQSVVIAAVAIVLSFGLGLWVALRGIVRPIAALTASMARLSQRDWGADVPGKDRQDEIGAMARTVETFKQNGMDADRAAAAERVSQEERQKRARHIEGLVHGFEAKIGDVVGGVAAAATEMKATAESMSATAAEANRQAGSVSDAAGRTSAGVQTTAAAAEELSSSIGEIGRQVAHSASLTQAAVEDARRTDGIVQVLAQGAAKIGAVVELITQIAGQTNLLALNATIEAARAGDAGKGFAVVASEVKNLASQTATATDQIASQISQIQSATEEAVAAIRTMSAKIGDISATASSIASAVEQQGAATSEIARSVQQTAANTELVTENIAGVSRAANDTGDAAGQVLGAAGELSQRAEQLKAEIQRFVTDVRAA